MKKWIFFVLFIIICYGFLWYNKNSYERPLVEVSDKSDAKLVSNDLAILTINLASLTTKRANFTLKNNSNDSIYYDSAWILEKEIDNTWYRLKMNNEITYGFDLYELPSNKSVTFTIYWQFWFGVLSSGHYRVIKTFYTSESDYEWIEKFYDMDYSKTNTVVAEFDIK